MFIITIDGPASSGKGTIASLIADKLGFKYLESGAIYRVIGLLALENDCLDDDKLSKLLDILKDVDLQFKNNQVLLNERDVTNLIRNEKVGMLASSFASIPNVRSAVLDFQRSFAVEPGLVTDGRDMGSVVFPSADLKIFLTASSEVRADRRHKQLLQKNVESDYQSILEDIIKRDKQDSERSVAPLTFDESFVRIDNSTLTINETIDQIIGLYNNK